MEVVETLLKAPLLGASPLQESHSRICGVGLRLGPRNEVSLFIFQTST